MIEDQETKAGELALALSWGYADVSEAVSWADEQIVNSIIPDDRLTEVSLANSVSDAIGPLNSLSKNVSTWIVLPVFLDRFCLIKRMSPVYASKLARKLFDLALRKDAPEFMVRFAGHWDDIDLAIDGIYGDPAERVKEFLSDIREVSAKGTSSKQSNDSS